MSKIHSTDVGASVCNAIPGSRPFSPIPNFGIGRVSMPGLQDTKIRQIMYFWESNDTNNNSSPLMDKTFGARYRVLLLLCTVVRVFTVIVTPYIRNTFCTVGLFLMHEISLLWIPKQRPFCKPNPETGSWDYRFLEIENSIPGLQSLHRGP